MIEKKRMVRETMSPIRRPWKKRKGFQEPDERVLNFTGTGHSRKEDCITEDKGQTPAGKTSERESHPGSQEAMGKQEVAALE